MKYFVVSDVHGYYTELITSLEKEGYDKNNKDHTLIICGDLFDRGEEALKLFDFIETINKDNLIIIRGNHEDLFLELIEKDFPDWYDFSNGTVNTFYQISGINNIDCWHEIVDKVKHSEIYNFINNDNNFKDYYEVGNYIFVHGFIPIVNNWRTEANVFDWYNARWEHGMEKYLDGYFQKEIENNKTLICGHISNKNIRLELDLKPNENETYYDILKLNNIICLDATTILSHKINVLVLDL